MRISEITEYNAISNLAKSVKKSFGPSRKDIWQKRLTPRAQPASPPPAPPSTSGTAGASFVQPMQGNVSVNGVPTAPSAAPQAKPRVSVRAATGPVYTVGQKKNVGGVFYTWDGEVWRDPKGTPATQGIAYAISQQSSQTS